MKTKIKPFDDSDSFRYFSYDESKQGGQYEFYSIGDVHGCAVEYKRLSDMLEADAKCRGKTAMIFQHGDLIDRGPEFYDVFKVAKNHVRILGNHEHNFILERLGKPCNSVSRKVSHTLFEKLSAEKQQEIISSINGMYNFAKIEIGGRLFMLSHAPVKNMETFSGFVMYKHYANAPYFCMRSSVPIDEDMKKMGINVTFIFGHQSWEYKDIEEQKREQAGRETQYYNIDSSCVYGDKLTAIRLRDLHVFQLDSNVKVAK